MATTINCPSCGCEIEMTALMRTSVEKEIRDEVTADVERRVDAAKATAAASLAAKDRELTAALAKAGAAAEQEAELLKRERLLDEQQQNSALEMERKLAEATAQIRAREESAAKERYAREADERVRAKDKELVEVRAKLGDVASKEAELLKMKRELEERERTTALDVERKVSEETSRIRAEEAKAAKDRYAHETEERIREKDNELAEVRAKMGDMASKEAELVKMKRELEERQRFAELEVERQVTAATRQIREDERALLEQRAEVDRDKQRLRDEEHRQQIDGLQRTVAELQRKVQQGSQQAQGEAQEVVLSDLLERDFPHDNIDNVPKGVLGADVIHRVRNSDGRDCGAVVWESKRTKAWSDSWLSKVKDDQREAGAACAVIVSQVLPPEVRHFALVDGVWVCGWPYAIALGHALRGGLIDVATARQAAEGRGEKMQMVFDYLTGTEFRLRVEGFVEAFRDLQEDLESERRAMATRWNRRKKLLERAQNNITAFYGDLRGIAGRQLRDLPALTLDTPPLLADETDDDDDDGDEPGAPQSRDVDLKELLFRLLPADGANAGNGSLSATFIDRALFELNADVTVEDYDRCKSALLAEGRIRRGKGRGGAVYRARIASAS